MKIVDYIIASGSSVKSLESCVLLYMNAGYEPYGGMATRDAYEYLQAMVKYGNVAPLKDRTQPTKPIRSTDEPMGYNS